MNVRGLMWTGDRSVGVPELVEEDIRCELEAHVGMLRDELIAGGRSAEEAERVARERFGDVEAVVRDCRDVRLRGYRRMQRLNVVLVLALVVVAAYAAWLAHAANRAHLEARDQAAQIKQMMVERLQLARASVGGAVPKSPSPEELRRRELPGADIDPISIRIRTHMTNLLHAPPNEIRGRALELRKLPYDELVRVLRVYPQMTPAARQQLIGPLVAAYPEHALELLTLQVDDPDEEVQAAARARLSHYAMIDFEADPGAFVPWWERYRDRSTADALAESTRAFAARVQGLSEADAVAVLQQRLEMSPLRSPEFAKALGVDLAKVWQASGLREPLERLVMSPAAEAQLTGWRALAATGGDEDFLRRHAAPLLAAPGDLSPAMQRAVYRTVGRSQSEWATQALKRAMLVTPVRGDDSFYDIARELGARDDPSLIPTMIGMIEADDTYATIYGIGWFGLHKLTGVPFGESHNGKWWRDWWRKNRGSFPATVRDLTIPHIEIVR
ncbi:MAG: permease prefix domain 1-containing protein [Planctomycetota bacterium]